VAGLRYIATAVVASAASFVIAAATGWGHGNRTTRFLNARPGDTVTFIGLDLGCSFFRSDPDHHEVGPLLYCDRTSEAGNSRGMGASKYHLYLTTEPPSRRIFVANRAP
jgi:hypothetical protein